LAASGKSEGRGRGKAKPKRGAGIDERLVKSLTHGLRVEILTILNERIASPNELSKELGEGLSQVSYHVKVLKDYECIELVKTEPRRGAVEHYYRATSRAFLSDRDWNQLPDSVRPGMSADMLELIVGDAVSGREEGSLDARTDRHMSRTPMILDEAGWKEVTDALSATLDKISTIQSRSSGRLSKSGEKGFTASVSLLGFEVPEDHRKQATPARKKGRRAKAKKS
jgi:DNA-binding transcriptional ArsR family regulator